MTSAVENNSYVASDTSKHAKGKGKEDSAGDIFSNYLDNFRHHGSVAEIYGGDGDDTISAQGDYVRVNGGSGNDVINAIGHDVRVYGGAGDDVINVQGNADWDHYMDRMHGQSKQGD
ncbi:MAG: hypothetical protein JKY27_06880, partial [Magnetovibrio sp.]|nr:hypothetical protein [Magnetovibrio sp.]